MEINAKHINELAKEMGFIRDNLEKMARLLQMLDVLFASPWKDKLVLSYVNTTAKKGVGAAIRNHCLPDREEPSGA